MRNINILGEYKYFCGFSSLSNGTEPGCSGVAKEVGMLNLAANQWSSGDEPGANVMSLKAALDERSRCVESGRVCVV